MNYEENKDNPKYDYVYKQSVKFDKGYYFLYKSLPEDTREIVFDRVCDMYSGFDVLRDTGRLAVGYTGRCAGLFPGIWDWNCTGAHGALAVYGTGLCAGYRLYSAFYHLCSDAGIAGT